MVLFINACNRRDARTKRLADALLNKFDEDVTEVNLLECDFPTADEDFINLRYSLIDKGAFSNPLFDLARQFASADTVVIAAPYWDLSFPASLKQYFEQINVLGITFEYSPEGVPIPLCKAKHLFYVFTAGGTYVPLDYGFGYVKALAEGFYGIKDNRLIYASGLDIEGADEETILKHALDEIEKIKIE